MTTSSKVSKLPNMHFRVWRVAAKRCKCAAEVIKLCRDNDGVCNPTYITSMNPKSTFARK